MDERTITAVRRRPAMYIGGTDKTGLHQLPCQVLDFMAFGHHANHTTQIHLTIHPDHSIAIEDDAIRPIPRDTDVLSYFHHLPDNIFSLGLSIVQALCEWFIFETWQGDSSYRQKFRSGLVDGQADTFSPTSPHGTRIWFRPDPAILADITDLSFYWLAGRSRHHCACNADLKIRLDDKRANLTAQYQYAEGLKSYLQEIQEGSLYFSSSIPPMIHLKTDIDSGYAEVAFCWSHRLRGRSYALHSFIHDVRTFDGGTHLTGFKLGLIQAFQNYAAAHQINPNNLPIMLPDVLAGIVGAINVRLPDPHFAGSIRQELENRSGRDLIQNLLIEQLPAYFEANPQWANTQVNWLLQASHKRLSNSRL